MELSDQQLRDLLKIMKDEEKKLIDVIERGKESSRTVSLDDPIGRVSRIDAIQQQTMAQEGLRRSEQRISQLRSAMQRWEDGTYGYCLACEEPIHFGRLKIRPESTLCMQCQNQTEQKS